MFDEGINGKMHGASESEDLRFRPGQVVFCVFLG